MGESVRSSPHSSQSEESIDITTCQPHQCKCTGWAAVSTLAESHLSPNFTLTHSQWIHCCVCVVVCGGGVVVCGGVWRWCSGVWRCVVVCGGGVVVCGGVWRWCSGVWRRVEVL